MAPRICTNNIGRSGAEALDCPILAKTLKKYLTVTFVPCYTGASNIRTLGFVQAQEAARPLTAPNWSNQCRKSKKSLGIKGLGALRAASMPLCKLITKKFFNVF
jgi:hypothetical protein